MSSNTFDGLVSTSRRGAARLSCGLALIACQALALGATPPEREWLQAEVVERLKEASEYKMSFWEYVATSGELPTPDKLSVPGEVIFEPDGIVLVLFDSAASPELRGRQVALAALADAGEISQLPDAFGWQCGFQPIQEGLKRLSKREPASLTTVPEDLLPDHCRAEVPASRDTR